MVMRMQMRAWMLLTLAAFGVGGVGWGQDAPAARPRTDAELTPQLEQRVQALSDAVLAAQQRLADSEREIQQLQRELQGLRQELAVAHGEAPADASVPLQERQDALEAAVKVHDQIKVESKSKYPLRVTGLLLFTGFLNEGLADNIDLPSVALRPTATSGNGSLGGSFRQTILGLEGEGPVIAGAHTSASVDLDFFSGLSYTSYGTGAGVVRFRTARIGMAWTRDLLEAGMVAPLISPLSPASYATVAEPALAGAGNLWTWAPQLRYQHLFAARGRDRVGFEFGLRDSGGGGYSTSQSSRAASSSELSLQPAFETRVSYRGATDEGLQLGLSGYYSRQAYPANAGTSAATRLDAWAVATDFRLPAGKHFELSGEAYRGRSLGGLGGGVYKDALAGTNPVSGASVLRGLNTAGGWTQGKVRWSSWMEANASIGLDDGYGRDLRAVTLYSPGSAPQVWGRNRMVIGNVIFRPKTYFLLSPEFRRVWTWPISGPANTLNVFTLSIGYQF
jgi:hypothetical protein